MSQDLVIRLEGSGALRWSLIESGGGRRVRDGEIAPDQPLPAFDGDIGRSLLLLPSEDLHFSRISLPARSESEARQAAPYLIEEELAEPLDRMTVAVGGKDEDGRRYVLAASADKVEAWRARLGDALVKPVHVLPDCAPLMASGAELTLFNRGDAVLFHGLAENGEGLQGGAVERVMESTLMPMLVGAARGKTVAASASLGLAGGKVSILDDELDQMVSRLDATTIAAMPPLLGAGLASVFDWSLALRAARRPMALAAALLIVFMGVLAGEGAYYRVQRDRVDEASVALFRNAFPEVNNVVNPQAQLNQRLRALGAMGGAGGQEGFLPLIAGLAQITNEVDSVRIDSVRFDAGRGGLGISASYNDFSDFEALREAAERRGLVLENRGEQESGGVLLGDFLLRRR